MLKFLVALTVFGSALVAAAAFSQPDAKSGSNEVLVARGKYLVTIASCNDCHTPLVFGPNGPAPDVEHLLSGHPESLKMPPAPELKPGPWGFTGAASMTAWSGPWGTSFTANLTPDDETGLGRWTEQQFVDTLRNGRHQGRGRELLPPMPWMNIGQMSDDDLRAVFAYLRSIPAIKNRVPQPIAPVAR